MIGPSQPAIRARSGASCAASNDLAPRPGSIPLTPASQIVRVACIKAEDLLRPRVRLGAAGMHRDRHLDARLRWRGRARLVFGASLLQRHPGRPVFSRA